MNAQYELKNQHMRDAENHLLSVKNSPWSQAATHLRRLEQYDRIKNRTSFFVFKFNLYFSFIFDIFFATPFKLFMLNGDFLVKFL